MSQTRPGSWVPLGFICYSLKRAGSNELSHNQFTRYLYAFGRSFERLQSESTRTLNILTLVRRFPDSRERITDLQLQIDRDTKAQAEHYRNLSRLCALLIEIGIDKGSGGAVSLWKSRADLLAQQFEHDAQELFRGR